MKRYEIHCDIPLPTGEDGPKGQVRGTELRQVISCGTPHPPLRGTLSRRERDSHEYIFCSAMLLLAGCANSDYRFERMDGDQPVPIPMKFDSLYGARDGDSVTAEARFSDGNDSAQMNVRLYLGLRRNLFPEPIA